MKKIILVIVILLAVAGIGHWYLSNVYQSGGIKITSPSFGDEFYLGEKMVIEWNNNTDNPNLNDWLNKSEMIISLKVIEPKGRGWVETITFEAPNTGKYEWVVTTESLGNKYKIEIHPSGARELVGRGGTFSIIEPN